MVNTPNPNSSPELREISEDDLREAIQKSIDHPGMTQNLFARSHGISPGHLSEFLNGKRRAEPAIAEGCGYRWALVEDTRATDDLISPALSPQTLPAPGEVELRERVKKWQQESTDRLTSDLSTASPTLAAVAAANDEGERADLIETFTEFADKIDRFGFVNALDGHATSLRAAIRLLSQGGRKA